MLGQAHHFRIYAPEKIAYVDRYTNEARRPYGVMNSRLREIALHRRPRLRHRRHGGLPMAALMEEPGHLSWADFPHLKGWFDEISARPAVICGVDVLTGQRRPLDDDPKAREMLFGQTQYAPLSSPTDRIMGCTRLPIAQLDRAPAF